MNLRRRASWLRTQWRDAWQFFIAPGIAALVPWWLGYRWLRWLSRHTRLFDDMALPLAAAAASHLRLSDEERARFAERVRLVLLLDHADLYLTIVRWHRFGPPWHVQIRGEWPHEGGFINTGFHYGTGHWIFRSLARAGRESVALYAERSREGFRAHPVRFWYGDLRIASVEKLAGTESVFRPHIRRALHAIESGKTATALIDVPPRLAAHGQVPVTLLDQPASLPQGLIKLARSCHVPLVPFWTEFDFDRGTRTLVIGEPIDAKDPAVLQKFADILSRQIRLTPEAWYFWGELSHWIEDAKPLHAASATSSNAA